MSRSLRQYGQLSPVTACWRDGRAELLDGFKRHAAAGRVSWPTLSVRVLEVDERANHDDIPVDLPSRRGVPAQKMERLSGV